MAAKKYPYKYQRRPGSLGKAYAGLPPATLHPPEPGQPPEWPYLRKLLSHIKKGVPWDLAAKAEGLDPTVHDQWIELGVLPGAIDPYKSYARLVYSASVKLVEEVTGAALAGAKKKNPFAMKVLLEMRFPNGIQDLRGDGKDDPVSSKIVRKRALVHALRNPNPELRQTMDDAGVIALTDAQREVLRDAGLLSEPKALLPQVVDNNPEFPPMKEDS